MVLLGNKVAPYYICLKLNLQRALEIQVRDLVFNVLIICPLGENISTGPGWGEISAH